MPFQIFFWSENCTILVCKLCLLFQTVLDLWSVLILEIFSCWDIKKGQFQFLVTFLVVFFLVCKLYKSGLYIIKYFEHRKYFTWGFLVFSFLSLAFLSILSLLLLGIFPLLEMLQLWSVNYICQVCKLYFYFGHAQNFGLRLYLSVFNKQWKCPTVSFN